VERHVFPRTAVSVTQNHKNSILRVSLEQRKHHHYLIKMDSTQNAD